MKKITILFTVLALAFNAVNAQTIFEWETADDHDDTFATETIDGITVTVNNEDLPYVSVRPVGDAFGTSGNIVLTGSTNAVTFIFDQPVNVNSILVYDNRLRNGRELTFTPTGGANASVVITLVGGLVPGDGTLDLNWTDVTEFTVEVTDSTATLTLDFVFDNLSVSPTLSTNDYTAQTAKVYPNPVENILYIKNISALKAIKVYNNLGELILQSKKESIDVSYLSKGVYFLQTLTGNGTETKRIIKK